VDDADIRPSRPASRMGVRPDVTQSGVNHLSSVYSDLASDLGEMQELPNRRPIGELSRGGSIEMPRWFHSTGSAINPGSGLTVALLLDLFF